jgi:DNA-binding MarR family transcriptional regulator
MNCDHIDLSSTLSEKRIRQAKAIFGDKIINKVLAWTLFLLGASKPSICEALDMKPGSLRSFLHLIQHKGLSTLESGSGKISAFKPVITEVPPEPLKVSLCENDGKHQISFGEQLHIQIPAENPLLYKSILLCLLQNHHIKGSEVARTLQISQTHVSHLSKKLDDEDIIGLIDQRRGQLQDYVMTPEIKGELIQQFVIDIVQDGKVSGEGLSKHLKERCQYELSPRTILGHLETMGLSKIKNTLPNHLATEKKSTSIP